MSYIFDVSREWKQQPFKVVAICGLCLATWLYPAVPNVLILILPAIVAFVLAIIWRSLMPAAVVMLSPVAVSFFLGMVAWFGNRPAFETMGLPGTEFFNLDRKTRCYWDTGGCLVDRGEWARQTPHNAGLALMVSVLGPPKTTYRGSYPDKYEAMRLTEGAPESDLAAFLNGSVTANGQEIKLGTNFVEKLTTDLGARWLFQSVVFEHGYRRVKAVIISNECLAVRLQAMEASASGKEFDESDGIILISMKSMRPFARYVNKGSVHEIPLLLSGSDNY